MIKISSLWKILKISNERAIICFQLKPPVNSKQIINTYPTALLSPMQGGRKLDHKRYVIFMRQIKMLWRMVRNLKTMMLSYMKIFTVIESQKKWSDSQGTRNVDTLEALLRQPLLCGWTEDLASLIRLTAKLWLAVSLYWLSACLRCLTDSILNICSV